MRDYLTDLFPILELGTSAKMLSVVPLLKGGGMFETGAGGSAPRHVQQFLEEGHLRWDSLGEFCALVASFEHCAQVFKNDRANSWLTPWTRPSASTWSNGKRHRAASTNWTPGAVTSTSRCTGRRRWPSRPGTPSYKARFAKVAQQMTDNEDKIIQELIDCQGQPVEIGGYYIPDDEMASKVHAPQRHPECHRGRNLAETRSADTWTFKLSLSPRGRVRVGAKSLIQQDQPTGTGQSRGESQGFPSTNLRQP